ncbi:CC166 protein, partial [Geococcyx californianus]|nr:CC166 protein [Geococcyx californianus]
VWNMASKTKQDTTGIEKNKQGAKTENEDQSKRESNTEVLAQERQSSLQKECKILTELMNTYMGSMERLLQENKFLEKEAQQIQKESHAYLFYTTKHRQKCQNLIITLNDQNRTDLSQVCKEKEKLILHYSLKEEEVRSALMNVETKLSLMSKEVEDLQHLIGSSAELERTQRIKELERELWVTRTEHADQIHKMKRQFLQDKAECEMGCRQKIQVLTERAEEAAVKCLIERIREIRAENWHLHQELLRLIQHSKTLKETKVQLEEQQQELLQQNKYIQDVAHTRHRLPQ